MFISTNKSNLKFNEKLFISWVGPRGIVAAGIASLFGSKLLNQGVEGAEYITPLVFMIVLGTVLLNATTARLFAKIVGVFLKNSEGILIVGASKASRLIANYLQKFGKRVVLIDANSSFVEESNKLGLEAYVVNIYDDDLTDNIELNDIGYLLALSGSDAVNKFAINNFATTFGEHGSFRLISAEEIKSQDFEFQKQFFTPKDDYINLSEVVRDFPNLHEVTIDSDKTYKQTLENLENQLESIPLFVRTSDNDIFVISEFEIKKIPKKGVTLIYVGQKI